MERKSSMKGRKRRRKLLTSALAGIMSFTVGISNVAYAAEISADDSSGGFLEDAAESIVNFFSGGDSGASSRTVSDYTVPGISPRGTTINLFDYWISGQNDSDQSNPANWQNLGINSGHVLKFGAGMGTETDADIVNKNTVNCWTGDAEPRQGIVSDSLGNDGYPVLSGAGYETDSIGTESLAYLFNSQSGSGKQAYMDVDGLLQVEEGYYVYNSQENFAEYDESSNSFILYNRGGVDAGGSSPDGQFFPFNTGDEIFTDSGNGLEPVQVNTWNEQSQRYEDRNIISTDAQINHYFGLSMSTRFIQQYGGHVDNTADADEVTYNFSGDDDVWIYIDNVLVGDLGGIHDASSIEINFATGDVVIYDDTTFEEDSRNNNNRYDSGETVYQNTTLGEIFGLDDNTFEDNTYHTLDFFYLERGNTDSNMSLRYNLVNIPESGVVKVDQSGDALSDVQFELYQADESYNIVSNTPYYTGATDENGELTFTTTNDAGDPMPVTLEELNDISDNWVLQETNIPEGYRNPGELHLYFRNGVLLSDNEWDTGAYSQAQVTVSADGDIYLYEDGSKLGQRIDLDGEQSDSNPWAGGILFAVVLQKQDEEGAQWAPVSGDAFKGWNVGDPLSEGSGVSESLLEAARNNLYQFLPGSAGAYEVDIENLPGDINTYYYMLANNGGDTDDTEYTIGYYWTSADSISSATTSNTYRVQSDAIQDVYQGFDRVFSVILNIPNIKNDLTLVKTNEDGTVYLSGAEYTLYSDENGDGQYTEGTDTLVNVMTTDENGELQVTSSGDILSCGRYVLVETKAPENYIIDDTPIQIIVDDEGVHVNSGTSQDNISVETGIGNLIFTMKGFAADDEVDSTLHDVKAQPQYSDSYPVTEENGWSNADSGVLHFQYVHDEDNILNYTPAEEAGTAVSYMAEAGWSRLDITQCLEHETSDTYKQNLGSQSLNALFTGAVTIHVTDSAADTALGAETSLTGTKTVNGTGEGIASGQFSFHIQEISAPSGAAASLPDGADADGNVSNTAGGTINFGTFRFDTEGTYVYQVTENNLGAAGYGYDTTVYTVVFAVSVSSGQPSVETVVYRGTAQSEDAEVNAVSFNNTYQPTAVTTPADAPLSGVKSVTEEHGSFIMQDGMFRFQITAVSAPDGMTAPMPSAVDENHQVSCSSDGTFSFGTITFTEPGEYTYSVSEVNNGVEGITYDGENYTLYYNVADNGGSLSITESSIRNSAGEEVSATDLNFTNIYNDGQVSYQIAGTKVLSTGNIQSPIRLEGGAYTFVLYENGAEIDRVENAEAAGNTAGFTFDPITYTEAGTHTYTVYEIGTDGNAGSGGTDENNVTFSTEAYTVTVTVSQAEGESGEHGGLSVSADVQNDSIIFTNTYLPDPAVVGPDGDAQIGGTKTLTGRDLAEGEFTFQLLDGDQVTAEAVNDADGSFEFGNLTFDQTGTYYYTISEKPGDDDTITYDDTVYSVTVTVTDNGTGQLTAEVTYPDGTPAFENTYTESEEPTTPEEPINPDETETPDEPTASEEPESSEKPVSAGSADKVSGSISGGLTDTSKAAETGDSRNVFPAVAAAVAALTVITAVSIVLLRRKRR